MVKVAGVVSLALTACSFAIVRPTPVVENAREGPICRSYAWPVADFVAAPIAAGALFAATSPFGDGCPDDTGCDKSDNKFLYAGAVASLAVLWASAIYGLVELPRCHAAMPTSAK